MPFRAAQSRLLHPEDGLPRSDAPRLAGPLPPLSALHQPVPFESLPHEWSFDQWKDAALLTLGVQQDALASGLSLKEVSPSSVQFIGSVPSFTAPSSFEPASAGAWPAYEQFCRHFLGPLLAMSHAGPDVNRRIRVAPNGLSVHQAAQLIPWRSRYNPRFLHLQWRAGRAAPATAAKAVAVLRAAVERLRMPELTDPSPRDAVDAVGRRLRCVRTTVEQLQPRLTFDLDAGDGLYSNATTGSGGYCVALDSSHGHVNRHYLAARAQAQTNILPLWLDPADLNAAFGRLASRGPADLALAFTLVPYLRIAHAMPFVHIAALLATLAKSVLIEFVPPADPAAQRLFREASVPAEDYTLVGFLRAFEVHFSLTRCADLPGTSRSLWLAHRSSPASR